jgi:hypothetical protein
MFRVIVTEVQIENETDAAKSQVVGVYPSTSVFDYETFAEATHSLNERFGDAPPADLVQVTITYVHGKPQFPVWE